MPRTEEANRQIRDEQRSNILNAARRIFARRGSSATMAEVAKEAGVSDGLAYRYFPSKDALFMALIEQMLQSSTPLTARIKDISGTPGERLAFLITKILEDRRDNPEFYQFFSRILADEKLPGNLRKIMVRNGRAFQNGIRQLIVEGQATGEVADDDPDKLVAAIMACLEGIWMRMASLKPEEARDQFPDAKMILRMLKPEK
ncbi:MAG TPA: TetR/AcrR family transcriptional regulator [Methanomassiliicoccales archaeon]|nr:TetR/AcrR family transcriptional regulator [Methanomassiliicoccales archaeon]